jgi:hypothetical protein
MNARRTTAGAVAAALLAAPLTLATAGPASAADREFRYGGANIEFDVEKDDGRFEVEVDLDDAKPGHRYRIQLWHDDRKFYDRVRTVDSEGDIEVERDRRNTRGTDTFKLRVKKTNWQSAAVRTIRTR